MDADPDRSRLPDPHGPSGRRPERPRAWLALLELRAAGPGGRFELLRRFRDPAELFGPPDERHRRLAPALRAALGALPRQRLETAARWLDEHGARIVTWRDDAYPGRLRHIPDPPVALLVRGVIGDLEPAIAIVGSRQASTLGQEIAFSLARELGARGFAVVSGLAVGIDTQAHRGALAAGAPTLAVLGSGLARIYPPTNAQLAERLVAGGGAVLSEYLPHTPPRRANFPERNRLISGLAAGVIVVEAAERSGSLITARLAGDQGREVFAVPGSIRSPLSRGCHALLKQGARLVESVDDVVEELASAWSPPAPRAPPAAPEGGEGRPEPAARAARTAPPAGGLEGAERLLEHVDFGPTPVELIAERSGLTADVVCSMLLRLELSGRVRPEPGGLYCRCG